MIWRLTTEKEKSEHAQSKIQKRECLLRSGSQIGSSAQLLPTTARPLHC